MIHRKCLRILQYMLRIPAPVGLVLMVWLMVCGRGGRTLEHPGPWTLEMRQGEGGGCSREPNGPQAQLSLPAAISLMIQQ